MDPLDDALAFFADGHEHGCVEVGSHDELPSNVGTIRGLTSLSGRYWLALSTAFVLPHHSFIHCVGSGPFSVPAYSTMAPIGVGRTLLRGQIAWFDEVDLFHQVGLILQQYFLHDCQKRSKILGALICDFGA
jgi:hypothetical protein